MTPKEALELQHLWAKYEDIAMHFNDLLIRLRLQSLGGIAAISTLVGIFTREGVSNLHMDWLIAAVIFTAMAFFWLAIWCLDFLYYNRLLAGSVAAIVELEQKMKNPDPIHINMSTHIEDGFKHRIRDRKPLRFKGVILFYFIVFLVIIGGVIFCFHMYSTS